MSRWAQLWKQFRLPRAAVLARSFKIRTQNFVNRLYDGSAVSRWRRQHCARAVQCLRAALDSPRRRALMLSATGVYKASGDDDEPRPEERTDFVTDEELLNLVEELERVQELSRATLYCPRCSLRLVIDTRHPGVKYCTSCSNGKCSASETADGWSPYMETQDVIIWRKEYKKGQGLYAYKVYGRYSEVSACDFVRVQIDSVYRRAWDSAVAALSTIEHQHRGLHEQSVIHWEVMWPRLFANRDYVYVRRHKEFPVSNFPHKSVKCTTKPNTTDRTTTIKSESNAKSLRYNSPSRAKRKEVPKDKVVVIVSKSCEHPKCPETKNAIRVTEYWSHMVIRSVNGVENTGMEFVLTYYDEPAVGGMPGGVAAWATGRAAPDYLARMRAAASHYSAWLQQTQLSQEESYEGVTPGDQKTPEGSVREQDMESSTRGPIIESAVWTADTKTGTGGGGAQTDAKTEPDVCEGGDVAGDAEANGVSEAGAEAAGGSEKEAGEREKEQGTVKNATEEESERCEGEESPRSWWRYLHPFYFFA